MGHKKGDKKQMEHAAMMKKLGITRTSGMCPMGCGTKVTNGGRALIAHLGKCNGRRR